MTDEGPRLWEVVYHFGSWYLALWHRAGMGGTSPSYLLVADFGDHEDYARRVADRMNAPG